jgi:tetratricopeptide (TPR) repeat protein
MRAFTVLAGALVCSFLAQAAALASNLVIYGEAVAALQSGDYAGAAEKFEDLIDQTPNWAPGHVSLGQCYYLLGRPDRAEESIRIAGKLDPGTDLFAAYAGPGQLLYKRKRYAEAIQPLELALEHAAESQHRSTSLRLGYAYYLAGEHDDARRALEAHRSRYGAEPEPTYYLALACQKLGDYACALARLREVAAADEQELERKKALEYLARWSHYWALVPENKSGRDELLAAAIDDTGSWYRTEPQNPSALEYYTEVLLAARRAEQLIREIVPVAQREETNCIARQALAEAFNALEDGRQAERWALEAANCDPSAPAAHVEVAVAYVLQLSPEHTSLAEVHHDRQLASKALESLDRAVQLDPARSLRATSLQHEIRETLRQLEQADAEFIASDRAYQDAVRQARDSEIRQRCQGILWQLRDETRELSAEDEAFYREHQCKQYARQASSHAEDATGQ